jgi:hypothetical protein
MLLLLRATSGISPALRGCNIVRDSVQHVGWHVKVLELPLGRADAKRKGKKRTWD